MTAQPVNGDDASGCPGDDRILAHLAARSGGSDVGIGSHIDTCPRCQTLVAEAARSLFDPAVVRKIGGVHMPRTLSPGERAQGRYEIRRFLGSGGMGEVYEAFDTELHETVALKTLACTVLDDEEALRRLKIEVYLARKVTHPNVCRIFEFGVYDRRQSGQTERLSFLTMELLRGETLGQRIARQGALSPKEAAPILRDIVSGLGAVHAAGIVHRDLKSDNVFLVSGSSRVVLMDFGLAKRDHPSQSNPLLSMGGAAVGTVGYTAPEQVLGAPASQSSDVYAFGTVVFEALTGSLPFSGDTPMDVAMARLDALPPPPSSRTRDLDPAWDAIVSRCLAREPAERFANMAQVAAALEAISAQPDVPAIRTERAPPEARSRERLFGGKAWLAAALLTAAALIVAILRSLR
jgi:serine/threonine protein kinase